MKSIIKQNNAAVVCFGLQRAVAFTLLLLLSVGAWAQSTPRFAVDLDVSGRQSKEVTEPGWIPWEFNAGGKNAYSDSITNEDVKVVISHKGSVGYGLRTSWYKTGVQAPYYARMANDGLTIDMGASPEVGGGHIELRLSGLKRAEHTIAIYLNNFSKLENEVTDEEGNTIVVSKKTISPVEVYANGQLYATVSQSNRVESNYTAAVAYVRFTPQAYRDYVIDLKVPVSNADSIRNISISGFELNAPDPKKQAWNPIPADRNEHVDADNRKPVTLRWNKSKDNSAVSYEVYFGKDFTEIDIADKTSAIYKGTQSDTTFTVDNLYSMDTYYWKVNAIDADGVVTEGNVWTFRPRILAFRGAEGYGRYARGGRGGKVVEVTNLNEKGPGSLRAAIDSVDGPTIIVFSVSGVIDLAAFKERISLNSSYVTVAGQTAPGKGICVRGAPFGISGGNDNIIRFMRVRLGQNNYTADGIGMAGTNFSIIDHSSISWTIDEAFSSRGGKSMTLQNTLISEALHVAGHKNYGSGSGHGYAATIGGDTASFLRNLLAHNYGRNWSLGGGLDGDGFYGGHLDIMNNIVYNYGGRVTDGGAHEVNFVNNYYKAGRHSTSGMLKAQHEGTGKGMQRYHARGNVLENYNNGSYGTFTCTDDSPDSCGCSNQWSSGETVRYQSYLPEPFFPSHATRYKATDAFKIVL
ncbi:MAG: T9SS C-terminal target domain-containing protein, partial [Prevotellaceae bacterium]|nr:T9SS C-terminal target domain-containing protein [Prevotellaceae bacterium]